MVTPANGRPGPIESLIAICARNWLLTLLLAAGATLAGLNALLNSPLDAIPDLSDVQVIVLTEWPGRSPDLVEDQVTYPLTTSLLAAPNVKYVRGQSFMGLSFVYVIFDDGTDMYWARSRVLEYLNSAGADLPDNVRPTLGPDATGVGWVYQYALDDKSGQHSLADLRSLQDFNLRYALEAVEGVAEIATIGGFEKEYQVSIDPNRLADAGISLQQVTAAVRASNNDIGGRVIEVSGHEHFVRGRGYIKSTSDLEEIVLGMRNGTVPIRIADVASVSIGPAMQRGQADLNGEGITVGGIVVMRYGENALQVINRVKARIAEVEAGLPEGVQIVPVYDRSALIERAITTLRNTLVQEMLIVGLVTGLFLWHFRSAVVAVVALPIAVLLAFIPMYYQGLTANIMSLGGIAVAIGAMVDAAIVMVDNIDKRLRVAAPDAARRRDVIIEAMQEVGPSVFFSLLIITVSFVPVFALEGTEGRLFKPLAFTKTYSMGFAALLAVTLVPALAVLLIRGKLPVQNNRLGNALRSAYQPLVRAAIRWRWAVIAVSLLAIVLSVPVYNRLGSEFMPPLNEGSILYMPTAPPGMAIGEATRVMQSMDRELAKFPEVARVFGKVGRSDSATDAAPLSMLEANIMLKPQSEWRDGMTWDKLVGEMDSTMQYPGMPNVWWMPIQTRTEMLATGIRSSLGIKVFGPDLEQIESTATAIERALLADPRTREQTRSAFAERSTGGYFLDFDIDRPAAARHGLNVDDVQSVIEAAVGGTLAGETVEGRERYGILVRYARDYRDNIAALERILVPTASGAAVPVSQLADINFRTGPPMLRNEDGQLVGFVFVDVRDGTGIADYVDKAKQVVADKVALAPGYRLEWAGQFQNYERARARLTLLVPITIAVIFLMLFLHRKSVVETAIVMSTIPLAVIGSTWLLALLDFNISVAVAVGMIAVAGLAVELGLLMVLYLDIGWRALQQDVPEYDEGALSQAMSEAAAERIRPMLMTSMTLLLGLLPIMLSDGSGADVMRRIAAPMLGGTVTSLFAVLFVVPAIYTVWRTHQFRAACGKLVAAPGGTGTTWRAEH